MSTDVERPKWIRLVERAITIGGIGGATVILFGATLKDDSVFGPTVAAWVQALGSIGAIIGAMWVVEIQGEQERARAEEARAQAVRDRLSSLAGILQIAFNLVLEATAAVVEPTSPRCDLFIRTEFDPKHFERAGEIIDRVPLHELPSADLAVAVHNAREAVLSAGRELSRFRRERVVKSDSTIDLSEQFAASESARRAMEGAWLAAGGR
jgi:hypothetical protein